MEPVNVRWETPSPYVGVALEIPLTLFLFKYWKWKKISLKFFKTEKSTKSLKSRKMAIIEPRWIIIVYMQVHAFMIASEMERSSFERNKKNETGDAHIFLWTSISFNW